MTFDDVIKVIGPLFLASLLLSFFLPILSFKHNIFRRGLKIAIIVAVYIFCFRYIQSQFYVEPYFPSYNPTVYVTDYGSSYHEAGCGSLWSSSHPRTLYEVVTSDRDYSACLNCDPPKYPQAEYDKITYSIEDHTPKIDEIIYTPVYLIFSFILAVLIFLLWEFNIFAEMENAGFAQSSKIIGYICILFGLVFLPGIFFSVAFLMILTTALYILSLPFALLFPSKKFPSKKKNTDANTPKPSAACSTPIPFSFNPSMKAATNSTCALQYASSSVAPAYQVCSFFWQQTFLFSQKALHDPTLAHYVYVWTAFFFYTTKHLRNQKVVDDIYTQFLPSATPYISDISFTGATLKYIQSLYRSFRQDLNNSDIDPRTIEGILSLEDLLAQRINNGIPFPYYSEFENTAKNLLQYTKEKYQLDSSENYYYMEAANGMTVRVPESKLDQWQETQDRIRRSKPTERSEASKQALDRVLQRLYHPEDNEET